MFIFLIIILLGLNRAYTYESFLRYSKRIFRARVAVLENWLKLITETRMARNESMTVCGHFSGRLFLPSANLKKRSYSRCWVLTLLKTYLEFL
jgi:hypothetical protein